MKKYDIKDYLHCKFGNLTILSDKKHKDKRGYTVYECLCDCGNKCYKQLNSVVNGHDKTCGKCKLRYKDENRSKKLTKDITGQRFGMLTAVRIVGSDKFGRKKWLFNCDCGNSVECSLNNVQSGNTKSCGCLRHKSNNRLDLIGKRFGRLIVEEFAGYDGKNARWLCRCDCGNIIIVSTGNLRSNKTKSCGCIVHEIQSKQSYVSKWAFNTKILHGWKCVKCQSTKNIHSHHILPKNKHPEYAELYSNGITLCYDCHREFHRKYGFGCNENSLCEFLELPTSISEIIRLIIEWRNKNGVQDLLKARHYIDLLISLEKKE
jgi:hypothetical protein